MSDPAFDLALARLRALPGMLARAAAEIAPELRAEITRNVAAQLGPDGKAWPDTADGRPALRGVGAALDVRAEGTTIVATLDGHHARHHFGWVRGGKRRPVLPSRALPAPFVRAVETVLAREFARTMGGA